MPDNLPVPSRDAILGVLSKLETDWTYQRDVAQWADAKLGVFLWSMQRTIAEMVREQDRVGVYSCHDSGKCVHVDEQLMLADGTWQRAGDLIGRTFSMLAFGPDGKQVPAVAWGTANGAREIWRVCTEHGRVLRRTGNHPLYAATRNRQKRPRGVDIRGWTYVEDLRVGDLVLVPSALPQLASRRVKDDECLLLGYLLGDGGLSHGQVGFSQIPGAVRDDFERSAVALGGTISTRGRYGCVVIGPRRGQRNPVQELVRSWGLLRTNSYTKHLPDWVWTLPDDQLALVMRALFDCDGHIAPGNVSIGLMSEQLIRDVQRVMTRLGIVGKVHMRRKYVAYARRHFDIWTWCTARNQDAGRFADVIGSLKHPDRLMTLYAWAAMRRHDRTRRWMTDGAPDGYHWEHVIGCERVETAPTVTISVEEHHTYISDIVEHNSFLAAIIGLHHIDTHVPKSARLITTAPSHTQVRGVLWNEMNTLHERASERKTPIIGRMNQLDWYIGSYQCGIGRKPNDYKPEQFAGFHARYVMVILDEADGLPAEMWEGVEALLTNRTAKLFAIGNPLDSGSHFSKARDDPAFATLKIAAKDTPNFTGEDVPELLRDVLLSREWVEGRRQVWGEDNPYWYGRVLAEYPPEALATIIRAAYIELCRHEDDPLPPEPRPFVQLGVDIAGSETGDFTTIRERRGRVAMRSWQLRSADDDVIEDFIVEKAMEAGAQRVVFDGTGLGFAFTGRLRKRLRGTSVIPINFGAGAEIKNPDGSRKYANMRAQLYWETGREQMRQGSIEIGAMEDYDLTVADLTSARYDPESLAKGIILVEEKAEIKRRLRRSPDHGDAFLLSFHEPSTGGGVVRRPDMSRASFPTGATAVTRH